MEVPEFPPNSDASKRKAEERDIKRVTSDTPARRRKPLRKQLAKTFVAGDARSVFQHVVLDVLIPAAKDMISDAGREGIDRLIYGESRRRGSTPPQSGPTGYVSYNRYSPVTRQPSAQRAMSRQARSKHDFDEIVLSERVEAESVIDQLYEVVSRYGVVSVADLYEMVGISSTHVDNRWGWQDLHGAGVTRVRGGFLLDLPEPEPLE